jgi:Domain of unknown function (DUF4340)
VGSPLRKRGMFLVAPLAAGVLIMLLVGLVVSGHSPVSHSLVPFTPKGLIAAAPSDVTRVEVRTGQETVALRRESSGWTIEGTAGAVPAELASHVDAGLRFMHVSAPVREIAASELTVANFAEFGLDPPASVLMLGTAGGTVATVNFGVLNPAGTSQYFRLAGAPTVYLMARHVGTEWQVAGDMARRLRGQAEPAIANRGTSLLLPVSLAQVWAVEIVFAGKLTRFERDGAGEWFRHVGQHSHVGNANIHFADPAQTRVIGAALDAFDEIAVEKRVAHGADEAELTRFGLAFPPLIVLLYARDSSTALARLELGAPADSFDRYARLAPDGDVVTVAEFEARRLIDLLKAVGAGS